MINENIADIVKSVTSIEDIDNMIELLKTKKNEQSAGNTFKNLFDRGYLIEIQYDDGCLVYVDCLKNIDIAGNTVFYKFGMFGTDGKITLTLTTKLSNVSNFVFSSKMPYVKGFDSLIFDNSTNPVTHLVNALVSCKLNRGIYDEKVAVPMENQALRCLGETRDKVQDAINEGVSPIATSPKGSSTPNPCDKMRIFTPQSLKENPSSCSSDPTTAKIDKEIDLPDEHPFFGVVNAIGAWLSNGENRRILADIDIKISRKENGISSVRRNNVSMTFKSLFFEPEKNTIVFGINVAESVDKVGSNSYRFAVNDPKAFCVIWNRKNERFEIKNQDGTQTFNIRLINSDGSFENDFYKTIEKLISVK